MVRIFIIFICTCIPFTCFASDSDIMAALRGEGLIVDSAADPLLAELAVVGNDASIQQVGTANKAITYQHGIDNASLVTQNGEANTSLVVQIGTANQALVTQKGSGSYAAVSQIGTANNADVTQSINGSYLAIKQIGNGGSAVVK
jgi:minor curlin subunit